MHIDLRQNGARLDASPNIFMLTGAAHVERDYVFNQLLRKIIVTSGIPIKRGELVVNSVTQGNLRTEPVDQYTLLQKLPPTLCKL